MLRSLRIDDVARLGIERRQRRDRAAEHRHRMRVVAEALQKRPHVLVHVRVVRDVVHPRVVLALRRQLAVAQQPRHLEERRLLGQLLDGISAIAQNSLVAVDEGDRAAARRRVQERGIVAETDPDRPRVVGLHLFEICRADRAVGDRNLIGFLRPLVGEVERASGFIG